jgi:hypothetical protein
MKLSRIAHVSQSRESQERLCCPAHSRRKGFFMDARRIAFAFLMSAGFGLVLRYPATAQQPASQTAAARVVGSITAIDGRTVTVKPDAGAPTTVAVSDAARIVRTASTTSLAGATSIQFSDLAVGDRVLLLIRPSADGSGQTATAVVAMKKTDIAQQQQAEQADWQRRGVAGVVKSVDPASGTVTIAAGARTWTVHTTPKTVIRRYSPDSNKGSDARPSTFDQIHVGDQLHARGDHSAEGNEVAAMEVISGSYRNIAGTVVSTDTSADTVTVTDLATKKQVVIHITADSQLHKLPPMLAQGLAARFKNAAAGRSTPAAPEAAPPENGQGPRTGGGQRNGDLSQALQRTPVLQLSELHKGDAVMIVATQGTPEAATAVTLIAGVEPILTASPSATQSMFSASWNLGGGGGEGEGTQ